MKKYLILELDFDTQKDFDQYLPRFNNVQGITVLDSYYLDDAHFLLTGNPIDGGTVIGPFRWAEDAIEYCDGIAFQIETKD